MAAAGDRAVGFTAITEPEALAICAAAFRVPRDSLTPELERSAIPGWDSWGAAMLMVELDERFALGMDVEAARGMRRIGDLLAYLRRHGVLR